MEAKLKPSQVPDQRLFRPYGCYQGDGRNVGEWISNREYKTRRGAEDLMAMVAKRHPRKNVRMTVQQMATGSFFVFAFSVSR